MTSSPAETPIEARWDTLTCTRSVLIVTVGMPATEPAKDTVPAIGAAAGWPGVTPTSTPQWPA